MPNNQRVAELGAANIAFYDSLATGSTNGPATGEKSGIIILVHGFASSAQTNWLSTGWVKVLNDAGYRVIAVDNRGHGQSSKFYEPEDYGPDIFANDLFLLMDHLDIQQCDIMGYSMGARIVSWMVHEKPERFTRAVFGGMGSHITGGRGDYESIAQALEADTLEGVSDTNAIAFRKFADHTDSDRKALAACIRPSKNKITENMLREIQTPVLVAVGSDDDVGGSATDLAEIMPNATPFIIEGLDHMKSTGAQSFKDAVVEFLK